MLSLIIPLVAAGLALQAASLVKDGSQASSNRVITPVVDKLVVELMDASGIPGLSLGVVRPDGEIEFGNWGIRSEKGDNVTSEVSKRACHDMHITGIVCADVVRYSVLQQSIPRKRDGHTHGRLRDRAQQHALTSGRDALRLVHTSGGGVAG